MPINKIVKMGFLICVGMILSYIEAIIPLVPTIPGIKIGLSNALVILILYTYGLTYGYIFQFCRIVLTAFIFGNLFGMFYSLAGAVISLATMFLLKKLKVFDMPTVSLFGGIAHNIAQLAVAYLLVVNNAILYYLPVLVMCGAVFGYAIGFLGEILMKRRLL